MVSGGQTLGTAVLDLKGDLKGLKKDLDKAEGMAKKRIESFGKKTQTAGLAVAGVGAAITLPLIYSISKFNEFEQSMANVSAVSGATTDEFDALTAVAHEMGKTTVFTAKQSADALSFMAMAGLEAEEMIGALPAVLNVAAAGQLELADSADIVTNIMAGYGIAVADVEQATDALVTGFTSANTDLLQLGEAFTYAGPVAKAAGIDFNETTAALSLMGNAGFQGSLAGTALRGAISRLLNPSAEAAEILMDLGVSATDSSGNLLPLVDIISQFEDVGLSAGDAMTIFGQRAGPGMLSLIGQGSESLRTLTSEMETAGGTAQTIADTQLDTLHGDITLLKSGLDGLAITIGSVIGPELRKFMAHLVPLIQRIGEWTSANPELTTKLVLVGVAVAGLALVIGTLLIGVGLIATGLAALAAGPVLLGIAAFGGLVAAAGAVIWNFDEVSGAIERLKPVIQGLMNGDIQPLISLLKEGLNAALDGVKVKFEELQTTASEKMTAVRTTMSEQMEATRVTVTGKMGEIQSAITEQMEATRVTVTGKMGEIQSAITEQMEATRVTVTGKMGEIQSAITEQMEATRVTVTGKMGEIQSAITEQMEATRVTVTGKMGEIQSAITEQMEATRVTVTGKMGEIQSAITEQMEATRVTVTGKMGEIQSAITEQMEATRVTVTGKMGEIQSAITEQMEATRVTVTGKMGEIQSAITEQFAVAMDMMTTKIGELKTSISTILMPAIQPLVEIMETQFSPAIEFARDALQWLSDKLGPLEGYLKTLKGAAIALGIGFALMLLPISGPVGLVIMLGKFALKFIDIQKVIDNVLKPALNWFTDTIMPKIQDVWENTVKPALEAFWAMLAEKLVAAWENYLKPALEAVIKFFETNVVGAITAVMDTLGDLGVKLSDNVKESFHQTEDAASAFTTVMGEELPQAGIIAQEATATIKAANEDQGDSWAGLGQRSSDRMSESWDHIQGIWDSLVEIINKVIVPTLKWLGEQWHSVWQDIQKATIVIIDLIFIAIETTLGLIEAGLRFWVAIFKGDWEDAWNGFKDYFIQIWEAILGIFDAFGIDLLEVWSSLWNGILDFVTGIWDSIKTNTWQFVLDLVNYIGELPGLIAEAIAGIPGKFGETFSKSFDAVKGWIARGSMVEYIKLMPDFVDAAIDPIPGVFDETFGQAHAAVTKQTNSMLGSIAKVSAALAANLGGAGSGTYEAHFDISQPPPFPQHILDMLARHGVAPPGGGTYGAPAMAQGGIVFDETIARIGEEGPEAVVPLDRLASMIGDGGGSKTEVHVHGDLYGWEDFVDKVQEANLEGARIGLAGAV